MSDEPRRPDAEAMPALVWGLMGLVVVALFVLALFMLHPEA
jgi:hypothetical protein